MNNIWNDEELELLRELYNPIVLQEYLDKISYDTIEGTASPRYVMKEQKANCFEGAILAAAILEYQGYKPLILDMMADNDDDHVIAVYKLRKHWGAVAKSNTSVLRYREPVYKSVRELVMSYFDLYLNTDGIKTLRSYSDPVNLRIFNKHDWRTTEKDLEFISDHLYSIEHHNILTEQMIDNLKKADPLLLKATLLGSIPEGLYKPE